MKQILDDKELTVLECISSSETPIGSWFLVEKLEEKGIKVSSATIGRILANLERYGYVEKEKYKGRTITEKGIDAIEKAKTIKKINYHKNQLDKIITTDVLEKYMMVLQARLAIERETAKLAAQNITEEEIKHLEEILKQQEEDYKAGKSIADDDINFHKAIAKASRNEVFEALYNIISTYKQQSTLFERIRRQVKSPYNVAHRKIFNAIKNHNDIEAEKYMIEHMENLMEDVARYWDECRENALNSIKDINMG